MQIYFAHIHSRTTYCLPVWQTVPIDILLKIQRLQNRAIKFINFLPRLTPSDSLYDSKLLSFLNSIKYENILMIHKISTGLMKSDVLLIQNFSITQRITSQSQLLRLPVFLKSTLQKSLFYTGIASYNSFIVNLK